MGRFVLWVDRTPILAEHIARVRSGPLALDSEADSFHHYHEKVCLIQLSFGESDLLLDPLSDLDLAPLGALLADRRLTKILHGADYDIRMLRRDLGLEIRGLFDTMVAARLVGERSFGLSALLEKFFDVKLDKRFQRADWSRRPLPVEMKRYAVRDTRYLEELAGLLQRRLEELGRVEWADEEFGRLESVCWVSERRPEEAFLRVEGIQALNRAELAVARELALLRESTARRRDGRPSFGFPAGACATAVPIFAPGPRRGYVRAHPIQVRRPRSYD